MQDNQVPMKVMPVRPPEDVTSKNLLDYSQSIRVEIVKDITKEGIPEDKDERIVLLRTLADMDMTSVNRSRIDIESQSTQNARAAQELLEKMYKLRPNGFHTIEGDVISRSVAPKENELPTPKFVDGELDTGVSSESSEEFLSRIEGT